MLFLCGAPLFGSITLPKGDCPENISIGHEHQWEVFVRRIEMGIEQGIEELDPSEPSEEERGYVDADDRAQMDYWQMQNDLLYDTLNDCRELDFSQDAADLLEITFKLLGFSEENDIILVPGLDESHMLMFLMFPYGNNLYTLSMDKEESELKAIVKEISLNEWTNFGWEYERRLDCKGIFFTTNTGDPEQENAFFKIIGRPFISKNTLNAIFNGEAFSLGNELDVLFDFMYKTSTPLPF
jgi:hypothetical protein